MISKTSEEIVERLNAQKADKQAALDAQLAPWRQAAEERRAREQAEREAARQKKEEQLQVQREEQFDRTNKTPAKLAWLARGGSAAEFEEEWPRLRRDLIADQTREALAKERDADRERMRRMF